MRDIKFKAWHKERKTMLYPPLIIDSMMAVREGAPDGPHIWIEGRKLHWPASITWDGLYYVEGRLQDIVLLQFTGLKDKNGVEIYDGDVVDINYGEDFEGGLIGQAMLPIKWTGHGFSFTQGGHDFMPNEEYLEVIGNIYENPDLLNDDKT